MRGLVRLSLRGRWGQVVALAVTMAFSATLVGALGVLTETGVRGQVGTGEYAAAPLLVGAEQTRPVRDDVDLPVPGRALLPASVVDAIAEAVPASVVVADRVTPAVVDVPDGEPLPVEVHPWSALSLGDRTLASGRAPEGDGEVVVPSRLDGGADLAVGDEVEVGLGEEAVSLTVVGTTSADDTGTDVADVHVADGAGTDATDERVAAVGVWPGDGADDDEVATAVAEVAAAYGARLWPAAERGEIEVVRQGPAKGALVSAAAAFGALAVIVSVFTLVVLTSLQVRERSRELSLLRVVGATPRQVRRLLRGEMRRVAVAAAVLGGVAGVVLGGRLVGLLRSWDVVPRTLEPVHGALPLVAAVGVVVVSAELAARTSARRVVRGSPLAGLEGADERTTAGARGRLRTLAGLAGLALGLLMACAPAYASGEAAIGLPALSGLVMAVSLGPLAPAVVRLAALTQRRRRGYRSAPRHLALAGLTARSARVGGALTPVVLGVSLSCTQLFSGTTMSAIADDQVEAGLHADLLVNGAVTGVGATVADDLAAVEGVARVDPVVRTDVLVLGRQDEPQWVPLPALAVGDDAVARFADLRPLGSGALDLAADRMALSAQAAAALGVQDGDRVTVALPDGREVERTVTGRYRRGLGFGDVLLPVADLAPATAPGRPPALAVTVAEDASVAEVEAGIEDRLADSPGLDVGAATTAGRADAAAADVAFPVLLLLILWGYIAIAVVNSLVVTTLARRGELATLRVVGATPSQQRRTTRWEAVFLAATGCGVASLASLPGLTGLTVALSDGERWLPGIDLMTYVVVVAASFGLVTVATELPTRRAMRRSA